MVYNNQMVIGWYRTMYEKKNHNLREMHKYLIGYSFNKKEHIYFLARALKYLNQKECARIIIEKGDLQ